MWRFAEMNRPTVLSFDARGRLWAASQDGSVWVHEDRDGDGRADVSTRFATGRRTPLGLHVAEDGTLYLSETGRITRLRDSDGDLVADEFESFVDDLPFGLHQNDNLKPGPDGWLYLGVGSTCDACQENDPRSGTIMRFDPTSGESEIFAHGMRNPYDLAFHPQTGALFATDNGRDDLGLDAPQEELNHVTQDSDYGWPGCWDRLIGPECSGTAQAVGFFEPHSSANSLDFYRGAAFPPGYDDALYVAGAPAVAVTDRAGLLLGYITRENIGELMVIRGRG